MSWNVKEGVQRGALRAEQPAAADALQPTLRSGFQARLSRSVRLRGFTQEGHLSGARSSVGNREEGQWHISLIMDGKQNTNV